MTPVQVVTVAALGGLASLICLVLVIALAVAIFTAVDRLTDIRETRRERRRDLTICRAIDALGTTTGPDDTKETR